MVTDFIYDSLKLSDFGYAIVSFNGGITEEINTDSQFSYNHVSMMRGKRQPYITAIYEDPLEMEMYICKNICESNNMNAQTYNISVTDMAFLKQWLVRPTPHKLSVIGSEYNNIYWNGSFKLEEYVLGDGRVGAHLTFECDAPFGYKNDVTVQSTLEANATFSFDSLSDEIGWIYPDLEIVVLEDGDLEITNSMDGNTMVINNCTANEKITIDKNLQISSSDNSHKILDDFNFNFYRVTNKFLSNVNTVTSNLPINIKITYTPYAKVVIV